VRISNDRDYLRQVMARAGKAPEVVLEGSGNSLCNCLTFGRVAGRSAAAEAKARR
jgi:hypothetical protein